jgi:hypothetical protein
VAAFSDCLHDVLGKAHSMLLLDQRKLELQEFLGPRR